MNATAQPFGGDPPPRAHFAALSLGGLEAEIVGQSLHLAPPDVKDNFRIKRDAESAKMVLTGPHQIH